MIRTATTFCCRNGYLNGTNNTAVAFQYVVRMKTTAEITALGKIAPDLVRSCLLGISDWLAGVHDISQVSVGKYLVESSILHRCSMQLRDTGFVRALSEILQSNITVEASIIVILPPPGGATKH